MVTMEQATPETLLMATLYKVGREIRMVDNLAFARVFNEAALEFGGRFKSFAWHRHYHVSEVLSGTLQLLDQAGSIVRENAAQTYFRTSPHLAGPFGQQIFSSLGTDQQKAVESIADRLKKAFGSKDAAVKGAD
ncbi:hypothetical protein PLANPX_5304 [Lacipirellula parvula]|uniref:Uncharacterized protein n=2 Tax=Lacipirellula parvula TaxID=2650471 RepID=A0A5K7XI18_9BACT|nr:hypothetical protein PLANPX_5304 [Lacipirellula parvula]